MALLNFYRLNCMHLLFYDRSKILFIDIVFDGYRLQICSNFFSSSPHNFFLVPFAHLIRSRCASKGKILFLCYSFPAVAQFACVVCVCVIAMLSVWIRLAWNKAVNWNRSESCHVKCIHGMLFFFSMTYMEYTQYMCVAL